MQQPSPPLGYYNPENNPKHRRVPSFEFRRMVGRSESAVRGRVMEIVPGQSQTGESSPHPRHIRRASAAEMTLIRNKLPQKRSGSEKELKKGSRFDEYKANLESSKVRSD